MLYTKLRLYQVQTVSGKQAVQELTVYLRTMGIAQRKWAKQIASRESNLRKLMIVQQQCKQKLKRCVLRNTYHHIKQLVNTDLLVTAQSIDPAPLQSFIAYSIESKQITPFSIYAMARLRAMPQQINTSLMTLIAELQGAWSVLPPSQKTQFNILASLYKQKLQMLQQTVNKAEEDKHKNNKIKHMRSNVALRKKQQAIKGKEKCETEVRNTTDNSNRRIKSEKIRGKCNLPKICDVNNREIYKWQKDAFKRFAQLSRLQTQMTLCKAKVSAKEWQPVAQAEWQTKTQRQKQCFLCEDD